MKRKALTGRQLAELYVLSHDLLPEEYHKPLHEWYNERLNKESHDAYMRDVGGIDSRETERNILRDDYYRHPYYSNRSVWEEENSPTYNEWTPYSSEYENMMNVESVGELYDKEEDPLKKQIIDDFYSQNYPIQVKRPNRSRLRVYSSLLNISDNIDNYDSRISDSLDRVVLSYVV